MHTTWFVNSVILITKPVLKWFSQFIFLILYFQANDILLSWFLFSFKYVIQFPFSLLTFKSPISLFECFQECYVWYFFKSFPFLILLLNVQSWHQSSMCIFWNLPFWFLLNSIHFFLNHVIGFNVTTSSCGYFFEIFIDYSKLMQIL